ncbi:hypothetical protein CER21_20150 [Klebsiella pneumoniae subsp. pneumoniae]|nr:hypothetical protein CER21_20150 [Klebsiella pneumoniae subsp. pneumoniae]
MKDQITHPPDNTDHSVAKQKFRITNWSTYNKALINRGSLTFWLDDEAIQAWYESATPSSRGRPQRYSDLAIILPTTQTIPWQSKSSESPTGPPTTKLSSTVAPSLSGWMMRRFRPGMSRQRLHHEEGPSAILISPSPPFW